VKRDRFPKDGSVRSPVADSGFRCQIFGEGRVTGKESWEDISGGL
jgi:hypothetical protein